MSQRMNVGSWDSSCDWLSALLHAIAVARAATTELWSLGGGDGRSGDGKVKDYSRIGGRGWILYLQVCDVVICGNWGLGVSLLVFLQQFFWRSVPTPATSSSGGIAT